MERSFIRRFGGGKVGSDATGQNADLDPHEQAVVQDMKEWGREHQTDESGRML